VGSGTFVDKAAEWTHKTRKLALEVLLKLGDLLVSLHAAFGFVNARCNVGDKLHSILERLVVRMTLWCLSNELAKKKHVTRHALDGHDEKSIDAHAVNVGLHGNLFLPLDKIVVFKKLIQCICALVERANELRIQL